MRIIKVELDKLDKTVLNIGWEGEQNHVQVQIQCGAFFAKYPNAGAGLTVLSPANVTYPVVLDKEGNNLIWDIDASDVVNAGSGKIQLTFTDGTGDDAEVIKTVIGSFNVNASLAVDGTAPDPIQHWIDQAEQTARQIAEESAIYAKEEIVESYGSIAPAIIETASGAIASFSDGADGMLVKTLEVDIDPVQDLHGYDSPWPAGGGKNLIPYPYTSPAGEYNGITFTINNDGTVNASGTSTNTVYFNLRSTTQGQKFTLKAGSYIVNGSYGDATIVIGRASNNTSIGATNINNGLFSIEEDTEAFAFIQILTGKTINGTIKPMIRLSSVSDATFAPYSNICPISGWTEANVTRTGKNLLNLTESGMINQGWNRAFAMTMKAGDYTLSCQNQFGANDTAYGQMMQFNDADDNLVKRFAPNYNFGDTEMVQTITLTEAEASRVAYLLFQPRANNMPFSQIANAQLQLEPGSTASTYKAFSGSTAEYEFPSSAGTVYGGSLTIHQDGSGALVVDRACVEISPDWEWRADTSYTNYAFYGFSSNIPIPKNNNWTSLTNIVCDRYMADKASDIDRGVKDATISEVTHQNGTRIWICDKRFTSVSDFKASLTGAKCVYEIATPVTYQLTNQQVIALLKGSNNIWADTGDVALEYPADTKLYIDGKVAELQALILENISNS